MLSDAFCMPPVVAWSPHSQSSAPDSFKSLSQKAPVLTPASARHPRTLAEEVLHQAQICAQLATTTPKAQIIPNYPKSKPNLAEPYRT